MVCSSGPAWDLKDQGPADQRPLADCCCFLRKLLEHIEHRQQLSAAQHFRVEITFLQTTDEIVLEFKNLQRGAQRTNDGINLLGIQVEMLLLSLENSNFLLQFSPSKFNQRLDKILDFDAALVGHNYKTIKEMFDDKWKTISTLNSAQ